MLLSSYSLPYHYELQLILHMNDMFHMITAFNTFHYVMRVQRDPFWYDSCYILDSWVIAWKNVLKRWAVWGGMEGDKDFLVIDYLRDLSGDRLT